MGIDKNARCIIIPVIILLAIGTLMVYSSSSLISIEKYGNSFHYLWRHLLNILIGFTAMIILSKIDYHKFRAFVIPSLIFSVILLILVFLPGIGASAGANSEVKRWINMRIFTFQPSELVKITMVLFLANYISKKAHQMKDIRYGVIIPMSVVAVFQGIILLQPDFGAVMSIGVLALTILFIGGVKWKYIFGVVGISLPVVIILILSAPYRIVRILCFMNPWQEPKGCGFQLTQSFLAFGRGGLTGVGIGGGKQKLYFLPEVHTDFIFSLVGEEAGLLGAMFVLGIFLYLLIKLFKVAIKEDNSFGYYLALGLTLMIGSQALINIGVSVGLMPTKGLPLPFISYGGSALLVNMAAVGILLNISKNSRSSLGVPSIRFAPEINRLSSANSRFFKGYGNGGSNKMFFGDVKGFDTKIRYYNITCFSMEKG